LQAGDYNGAVDSSRKAKIWSWVSFGLGIILALLILAAIAIPQFFVYRERANYSKTNAVLQQVCSVKEAFFITFPDKEIAMTDLTAGNVTISSDIELTLEDGTAENFTVVAINKQTNKTYVMKKDCAVEELPIAK
jgi:Tfp pilus assembly protein PilE